MEWWLLRYGWYQRLLRRCGDWFYPPNPANDYHERHQ